MEDGPGEASIINEDGIPKEIRRFPAYRSLKAPKEATQKRVQALNRCVSEEETPKQLPKSLSERQEQLKKELNDEKNNGRTIEEENSDAR